jgi:hypothetical protein
LCVCNEGHEREKLRKGERVESCYRRSGLGALLKNYTCKASEHSLYKRGSAGATAPATPNRFAAQPLRVLTPFFQRNGSTAESLLSEAQKNRPCCLAANKHIRNKHTSASTQTGSHFLAPLHVVSPVFSLQFFLSFSFQGVKSNDTLLHDKPKNNNKKHC